MTSTQVENVILLESLRLCLEDNKRMHESLANSNRDEELAKLHEEIDTYVVDNYILKRKSREDLWKSWRAFGVRFPRINVITMTQWRKTM